MTAQPSTGLLRNRRYELFAQGLAAGYDPAKAYQEAGFKGKNPTAAAYRISAKPEVQRRVKELLKNSAIRAELSRKDILDRILEDWESSRKLGQMASALKAAELIGRETHRMFTERKEIGGPGDFDTKSEEELRQIINEGLTELGWDKPPSSSVN